MSNVINVIHDSLAIVYTGNLIYMCGPIKIYSGEKSDSVNAPIKYFERKRKFAELLIFLEFGFYFKLVRNVSRSVSNLGI